jgi:hypothetical protein
VSRVRSAPRTPGFICRTGLLRRGHGARRSGYRRGGWQGRVICHRTGRRALGRRQKGEQVARAVLDVIVEELVEHAAEFTVGVLRKVFEGKRAGDYLAPRIGLTFGIFFAGLELLQLIGDLLAKTTTALAGGH